jgi:hypothetical protein
MVATHLYIGYTYFDGTSNVDVAPFLCISFDTYNGYNQYSFTQTINGTFYEFSVQWNNTTEIWELITVYPTNNLVATIPTQYATAQYPGDIESVYWNVEEDNNENIIQFYSYTVEVEIPNNTVEACTYWLCEDNTGYFPTPWQDKVWYLMSDGEGIFVGQVISEVTFDNGTPLFGGTGVYHVGAILYTNSDETEYSTTYSTIFSEFVGIIVMDSNNNFVLPIPAEESYNQGTICLAYPIPPTEADLEIECFQKAVWSKQCQYSSAVDNYRQAMIFGSVCCDMLENLKQQRRILHILNCYDTKDIPNNTTLYNTFTYTQIQQLLTL